MKHTKRPLSLLLTLCLLLGLLPTTVWASYMVQITQQPTAENNYTVEAKYGANILTEGFQWWKKISVPETYNLVESNPAEDELGVASVYYGEGSYIDGHWAAKRDTLSAAPVFRVSIKYITSPGDQVTVRIPPEMANDTLTVENGSGDSFQKMGDGVYTATFDDDGGIWIKSSSEFTAVITVDRYWTPVAGETTPSLNTRDLGKYYCAVSHESGDLMSKIVTLVSPEDQPTVDWLADPNIHMLALGPVEVTQDNYDDIFRGVPENVASGKASFAVVNGTPTLTLDGVTVEEGYEADVIRIGLLCSDELTIVLADGSDNNITISGEYAMGIMTGDMSYFSPLTVTGTGTLTVSASASGMLCFGVYAGGIQVTGGAEFTVTASTPVAQAECIGLNIDVGGNLQVSDGGVVRISGTTAAAAFGDDTVQILADGYSIQGSTTADDFTNLADAELKKLKEDGDVFTLKVGDEVAKSVVIAPAHSHTWSGAWTTNGTHHWHNCTNSDCTVTDDTQKDGYAPHIYNDVQDIRCSVCAYVRHYHTWSRTWTTDDTHHWHKCTAPGCPVTDPDRKDGYAPHTAVTDPAKDPTCTEDGKTEGSHCSVCGYVITAQETIPAGHTWGKWTLQADGQTVKRVCEADASHTESKTLAITLDKSSYVYNGGENTPTVTVKVGGATLTLGTDYTVSYKDNVNKGTATVTVTGKGSYAGSTDQSFTVTAKTLTATAAKATDRAYDGTTSVAVTDVTLDGVVAGDDVAVNTTGLKGTVSSPDAIDTPYETVTLNSLPLTGAKAGNYTVQVNVTLPTSVTISKATPPKATEMSRNITNKLAKEYTFALANLLPQLNAEGITENRKDWGTPFYTIQDVTLPDGYYDGENAPALILREDGMAILHLPIRFNEVETTGEVGSITVEIRSNNYETFSNVLKINANNKTSVGFEGISIASRAYNGQPIAYDGTLAVKTEDGTNVTANIPAGHIEITYKGVDGTAYGGDRSEIPPTNAGSFAMVVRMADEDENYIGVKQFPFVISKAPGRGSVTMADFICGGEPSVPVPASDTNGVEGVSYVYKVRGAADETYSPTKPVAPGEYTVRASFPAATNYEAVTATADFTVSHAWANTWSSDETGHWHACTNCGEKKDAIGHVYGSDEEVICADCGYDRSVIGDQTKGEVELKPGTDTPEVTTDTEALKDLGGEIHGWQTVTVKLTVEKQEEPADKDEIAELVTGKKDDVLYLDLSLLRQINSEEPEAITDTGSKVLEITVTYDFTGKKDVTVYRKHGNTPAAALTGLTERPDGAFTDGTFYTDTVNGKVYIYASKFSTYAIGYTARTGSSGIYYTLTATAGQGGSISPSGKVSLRRNETKTFAITPDAGYRVADVLVDGKSVGPVTEYTFERIAADHTIEVVFWKTTSGAADCARDDTCPISKFPDTETEAWYHDGVHYCLETGLMVGTSETTFAPVMETSRAMIATILWRLSGSPKATAEMTFPDCEADSGYAQAVAWCAEVGVVKGYDSGDFYPDAPITREQLAVMLWRYAGSPTAHQTLSFPDTDRISDYALEAVRWAAENGIVLGHSDGRFEPQGLTTRAQVAAMLQRFLEENA